MSSATDAKNLLLSVKRDGMEELVTWLESTDFFVAPASTKYHGNYEGGLVDHSLNVYDAILLHNYNFFEEGERFSEETLIIVALLHDVCKANFYKKDDEEATGPQMKYLNDLLSKVGLLTLPGVVTKAHAQKCIEHLKNGGNSVNFPESTQSYKIDEKFPMGHGEKSLYLIQQYMLLTDEEAIAIRWHLGAFDPGFHFSFPSGRSAQQAVREYKLCPLLIAADFAATWLADVTM